jgi:hypothetical protein
LSSQNAGLKQAASTHENKPAPPEKPKASEQTNPSSTTSPSTDPFQAGSYKSNGTGEPSSVASPVLIFF